MNPELRTVQVWSVLTKLGTIGLGILQTAVVLRLLGPKAYGIVGIVVSLGALVGVSQHVGAVDAAIREIAIADSPRRRATVFWVSFWFRLAVTVPISVALALLAPWIGSRIYPLPDIPHLVRLTSVLLVLYGIQGILGGAYTGQRAFGRLYALQLATAALNVPLFAGLVWWHGVRGFFEAALLAAVVFCGLLALFLRHALGGSLAHPRPHEARPIFGDIVHTGAWTYAARILSVAWQRVPVLLLGVWAPAETVGLFNAAVTFGAKLQLLAAALGEVNLSFLSNAFAQSREAFRRLAVRALEDVGAVTLIGALLLVLFADVLVPILAGREYADVVPLIPAVAWAYAAFAFVDIATNTVFVPARQSQRRAASYLALFLVTVGVMALLREAPVRSAEIGLLAGGVAGLLVALALSWSGMRLPLFPRTLVFPLAVAVLATAATGLPLAVRGGLFLVIAVWVAWAAFPSVLARLRPRLPGRWRAMKQLASKDVIVFAGALYDAPLWTNRQHIATRLAEHGWRVLYVEPRLFLWRQLLGRFPGTRGRWSWLLRHISPQRVRPNLWVQAQANLIPGSRRGRALGRLNHRLWNAWHVRLHAWELGFGSPVLLMYDTEAAEFLDDFPSARVVYDCVDDHRAQAGVDRNPALVEREEGMIAARADAIAVTAEPLFNRFTTVHRNVHRVPNAADVEAFLDPRPEPSDLAGIPHPRIGTVGALDAYKIDVDLLKTVAAQHPEWHVVLVGPVEYAGGRTDGVRSLRRYVNIHVLGLKPHPEIPAYVHAFDVAMIPYRESAYNRSSFPLKFWEFMASGKPIVASGVPALAPYAALARLVQTPDEFAGAIQEALRDPWRGSEARVTEARRHGWETRVAAIERLLQG